MKRLLLVPLLLVAIACPKDRDDADTIPAIPLDTTPVDLSDVASDLPPAAPDTFRVKPPAQPQTVPGPSYPAAPDALMEAVRREQSATQFCYNEFGLKNDPNLRGNVVLLVTVGQAGITSARVGNSIWSPAAAGRAVNTCLNEKAKDAFKVARGTVQPGTYRVPLSFATR
jgi:hypothetical protein